MRSFHSPSFAHYIPTSSTVIKMSEQPISTSLPPHASGKATIYDATSILNHLGGPKRPKFGTIYQAFGPNQEWILAVVHPFEKCENLGEENSILSFMTTVLKDEKNSEDFSRLISDLPKNPSQVSAGPRVILKPCPRSDTSRKR